MKRIYITFVLSLLVCAAYAQTPFYLSKQGAVLKYENRDAKDKATSITELTVTDVNYTDALNFKTKVSHNLIDIKTKKVIVLDVTHPVTVENGVTTFVPTSLVAPSSVVEGLIVEGDNMVFPATLKVGDTLNDYTLTLNVAGIKTQTTMHSQVVDREETVTIDGQDIECIVVKGKQDAKVLFIRTKMSHEIWYGRGYGPIITKNYDKKGKLVSSQVLVSISGL